MKTTLDVFIPSLKNIFFQSYVHCLILIRMHLFDWLKTDLSDIESDIRSWVRFCVECQQTKDSDVHLVHIHVDIIRPFISCLGIQLSVDVYRSLRTLMRPASFDNPPKLLGYKQDRTTTYHRQAIDMGKDFTGTWN